MVGWLWVEESLLAEGSWFEEVGRRVELSPEEGFVAYVLGYSFLHLSYQFLGLSLLDLLLLTLVLHLTLSNILLGSR